MAHCPECSAAIDLDEDEVEEGEIMSCPDCEADLEVVSKSPLQLNALSEDDDLDEEEEEEDEGFEEDEEEDLADEEEDLSDDEDDA